MNGPTIGDAFGQMLLERMSTGPEGEVPEFVEKDDGYLDVGESGRYFAPFEGWRQGEQALISQLRGRILDIGAGAARVSLHLQERGCDVVALDVSKGAVEVCQRRGIGSVFDGTIYDLVATSPAPFDGFVLCGNNMGLLGSREDAPRFLATLAAMARPGAVVVGTWTDPYRTDNPDHLAYHQRNRERGRMPGQLRLRSRHRNLATAWFDYLFCSPAEAEQLIGPSAWVIEELAFEGDTPVYTIRLRLSHDSGRM